MAERMEGHLSPTSRSIWEDLAGWAFVACLSGWSLFLCPSGCREKGEWPECEGPGAPHSTPWLPWAGAGPSTLS